MPSKTFFAFNEKVRLVFEREKERISIASFSLFKNSIERNITVGINENSFRLKPNEELYNAFEVRKKERKKELINKKGAEIQILIEEEKLFSTSPILLVNRERKKERKKERKMFFFIEL